MDIPPPYVTMPVSQVKIVEYNSNFYDEFNFIYFLSYIDTFDIPQKVKQYAKDNDCKYLEKSYYWSWRIYKNKGGVYSCSKNDKNKYIYDNSKKLRFAKWYETYKIRHTIIYGR